jgi:hypothetical protein
MNIFDHFSQSLGAIFGVKILKFFDADADRGIFLTLFPRSGMEKSRSVINIPVPQHCMKSVVLLKYRTIIISEGCR